MTIKAKICGLSTPETVRAAVEAGASYIGFVFYAKSPRNVTAERAAELAAHIPPSVVKTGVFVNPDDELLDRIVSPASLDLIQLHGTETAARVTEIKARFKLPVIKAFSVSCGEDLAQAKAYEDCADMLLFDAKAPVSEKDALPGGMGHAFDWRLIRGKDWNCPWMLSGGLNAKNIADALAISGARLVDVSSGVESSPGEKSIAKINQFLTALKDI